MPPRLPSRNENLPSLGDKKHGLESRRTSRHNQPSRFARETSSLSPRAGQSLKFKDKGVKIENPIRPPYADLPLEFVNNAENGYFVQAKYSGDLDHLNCGRTGVGGEDELIKYMSKVPEYLNKGENVQDNALNFGVLDWGRLEKWTNKQSQSSTSNAGFSIPSSVDFSPLVRPMKEKVVNSVRNTSQEKNEKDKPIRVKGVDVKYAKGKEIDQKPEKNGKDKSSVRDGADLKFAKGKEKCLHEDSTYKKPANQNVQPEKSSEGFESRDLDSSSRHCSGAQDSVVYLCPRDFSRPCSSEVSQNALHRGKSGQHNWGSFSDFFCIDEIHTDEPFSDIPHSSSLNQPVETENDLDFKLDSLIKAQGVEFTDNSPEPRSNGSNVEAESKAINDSDEITPRSSFEMNRESSLHQRLGFRLSRMTKSLSFKEGSLDPPPNSTYVTAKSGPAKPESSVLSESSNSNNSNIPARPRFSQFKRLLNPMFKSKEHIIDLRGKPPIPVVLPEPEKYEMSIIKAALHLTFKSGLPLFKFVVETNNEILASTVKSLSSFGKDDKGLMYTFYSVHKVRKKTSGWKSHKVKPFEFGYNVVGQMKVSKPHKPSWLDQHITEGSMVKESVLFSVDVSKPDTVTSELMTGRELAAVVVRMPDETSKYGSSYSQFDPNEVLFDFKDGKLSQSMVILPGGDHSLPHEGVPSSLINRWRTGGLCDCGGWDEGCKLRILTDLEKNKSLLRSRSRLTELRCDLYDQGEPTQSSPFFRIVPFRDGLFSVEFDTKMSSLQAFSVCVALINSRQPTEISAAKAQLTPGEGPERRTQPHPPVSPVGRV